AHDVQDGGVVDLAGAAGGDHAGEHHQADGEAHAGDHRERGRGLAEEVAGGGEDGRGTHGDHVGRDLGNARLGVDGGGVAHPGGADVAVDHRVEGAVGEDGLE